MLSYRLVETPLAPGSRDADELLLWLLRTFGLVRRKGSGGLTDEAQRPLLRLMREHFLNEPNTGHASSVLAESVGISNATLHHHLVNLHHARLLVSPKMTEGGWRIHALRAGSLKRAIDLLARESIQVLDWRLSEIKDWWNWPEDITDWQNALLDDGTETDFTIGLAESTPHQGNDGKVAWLNDLGLMGERPGDAIEDGGLQLKVLDRLLSNPYPLSIEEGLEKWPTTRSRLQRVLDRFQSAGLVIRGPRLDRLPTALWGAFSTQWSRRGGDWLLAKGGLNQLPDKVATGIIDTLEKDKLAPQILSEMLVGVDGRDQILLLNRLGGRLALGWRMSGGSPDEVRKKVMRRFERVASRVSRVAGALEEIFEKDSADINDEEEIVSNE